jgi:hypothetical protein
MANALGYPVYDADNHLYEPEEAMTAHLPKKWRSEFQYVEVNGRKKLAIGGQISDYIPNPTFDVLAAPGAHEKWYRGTNREGLSLRELTGEPIACLPAYRNGADRLTLMDEQGIHAALIFPTLASAVEERMNYDHELMNAVLHSLNVWMHEAWGFAREGRIFAVPFVSLMDVELAVRELEWCLERGARSIGLRPAPVPGYRGSKSFGFAEFDPFWARVAEAGIFVALHASDSGYDRFARMWEGGSEFLPFKPDPFKSVLGLSARAISDSIAAASSTATRACASPASRMARSGSSRCSTRSSMLTVRCRESSRAIRTRRCASTSSSRRSTRSRSRDSRSGSASRECCSGATTRIRRASRVHWIFCRSCQGSAHGTRSGS